MYTYDTDLTPFKSMLFIEFFILATWFAGDSLASRADGVDRSGQPRISSDTSKFT